MHTSTENIRQKQESFCVLSLFGTWLCFGLKCAEWIKLPSIFCTQVTAAPSDSCLRATPWWLHWSRAAEVPFDSFPNVVSTATGNRHRTLTELRELWWMTAMRGLFVFQVRVTESEKKTSTSLSCVAQSVLKQAHSPGSLFAERWSDCGHFRIQSSHNHRFD